VIRDDELDGPLDYLRSQAPEWISLDELRAVFPGLLSLDVGDLPSVDIAFDGGTWRYRYLPPTLRLDDESEKAA
jgi:hypothetical protein